LFCHSRSRCTRPVRVSELVEQDQRALLPGQLYGRRAGATRQTPVTTRAAAAEESQDAARIGLVVRLADPCPSSQATVWRSHDTLVDCGATTSGFQPGDVLHQLRWVSDSRLRRSSMWAGLTSERVAVALEQIRARRRRTAQDQRNDCCSAIASEPRTARATGARASQFGHALQAPTRLPGCRRTRRASRPLGQPTRHRARPDRTASKYRSDDRGPNAAARLQRAGVVGQA